MKNQVLEIIKSHGPIWHGDIAKMMGLPTYQVLETIYPMFKAGAVRRDPSSVKAKWYVMHLATRADA